MNILKRKRVIKDLIFVALAGLVVATLKNNGDGVAVFITDVIGTFVVTVAIMMVIRHICRETIKEEISLAIEEHLKLRSTENAINHKQSPALENGSKLGDVLAVISTALIVFIMWYAVWGSK